MIESLHALLIRFSGHFLVLNCFFSVLCLLALSRRNSDIPVTQAGVSPQKIAAIWYCCSFDTSIGVCDRVRTPMYMFTGEHLRVASCV